MPAITDAEIHRLGTAEQLGIGLLIPAGKLVDRAGVAAERSEAPLLRAVIAERNSGIVLDDGCAFGENEVAHRRKAAGMQKIRGTLQQAIAGGERGTKFQEAA